jgi:hypothetical protein
MYTKEDIEYQACALLERYESTNTEHALVVAEYMFQHYDNLLKYDIARMLYRRNADMRKYWKQVCVALNNHFEGTQVLDYSKTHTDN